MSKKPAKTEDKRSTPRVNKGPERPVKEEVEVIHPRNLRKMTEAKK